MDRNFFGTNGRGRVVRSLFTCLTIAAAIGCGGGNDGGDPGGPGGNGGPGPGQTSCAISRGDIAVGDVEGGQPSIVWSGANFAVAWTDFSKDSGDIRISIISADGKRLNEQVVEASGGESKLPSVVHLSNGGYIVFWQDVDGAGSIVRARRVAEDGTPQGSSFQVTTSGNVESRPSGAAFSGSVLVGWMDATSAYVGEFQNDSLGATNPLANGGYPAIGGAESWLGAVWTSGPNLGFSPVSAPLGSLTPVIFRDAAGRANVPRISADDAGFLLAWEDTRYGDGNESVFFTRIGLDGIVQGELEVPSESGSANYPDVVRTGSNTAVVYYQFRDGPAAVYLSLIAQDMSRVGSDLQISGNAAAKYPRAAWNGSELGVAYAETDGSVRMALVSCP